MSKLIGYTTGVFDLFHVGHLNILRRASMECDYLIVGVTTDELSLERKKKAPIIPFEERMSIVESIRFVDEVAPQTTMDKLSAWRNLKFDRMFVGNDWKGTDSWNRIEAELKPHGVEIIYFPYTEHTSSSFLTSILEKI